MVSARYNKDWADQFLAAIPAGVGDAAARTALAEMGLPSRRVESWRYTDLGKVLGTPAPTAAFVLHGEGAEITRLADLDAAAKANLLAGDALPDSAALDLLNKAALQDGAVVHVAKQASLTLDVGAGHTRTRMTLAPGAEVTLVERLTAGADLGQHAVKIDLGAGSIFRHVRLVEGQTSGTRLIDLSVSIAKDAAYRAFTGVCGGGVLRGDMRVTMNGEGAELALFGASQLSGQQHLDLLTHVTHAVPNALSRQAFYAVLGDKARSIYQGKVRVEEGAVGTEAHQLSRAVLLNAGAEADHKPELEIFADAVECSHGATTGAIDEDQLFYLQARGIPEAEARALLIAAFLTAAVEEAAEAGAIPAALVDEIKAKFGGGEDEL